MDPITASTTEQQARTRVENSEALSAHVATIWSDWSNDQDHVQWVATAPEAEIVAWAEIIEQDAE